MPIAQLRNASLQELGSPDHLPTENKNFGALWYDATGGQAFSLGSGDSTLNLDTEKVNSAPEIFSLSSDVVTLLTAGLYLFSFQLMAIHNGGSSACVNRFWLEEDPDSGSFSTVLPAVNYFPMAAIPNSASSGMVTTLLRAGIDYRYRIRFNQSYGSSPLLTVADGSYLSIVRLFKNG